MVGLRIEWKRRWMMLGIAVGVFAGYKYILPAAVPFLAAWVLAAWIYPAALKIERWTKMKRSFAGAVMLAGVFALAGGLLYVGAGELLAQIKTAVTNYPMAVQKCRRLLDDCCLALENATGILREDSRSYILTQMDGVEAHILSLVGEDAVGTVFSCVKNVLFVISGVMVTFISTLLIMGDMENLRKKIREYSWLVGTRRVVKRLQKTTVTYLKAQLIIIILISVTCSVGFWMMGSPYFLIFGIVLGVFDAVPIIGTGTFLYPAAVVLLIRGNTGAALGSVLLDAVTSVQRELLEPKLLGAKLGVPPLMVLASVYFGILLFGGWGVILGPLSFSTAYEIGREWDVWD